MIHRSSLESKTKKNKTKQHPARTQNYIDKFILFAIKFFPHFLILACMQYKKPRIWISVLLVKFQLKITMTYA